MRLIDADALKKAIIKHLCVKSAKYLLQAEKSIYDLIDKQPTIELLKAEQPKHGHWIDNDDPDDNYFTCSVCGDLWILNDGTPEDNQMNYCPHCGARMDGEYE